jgi:hypothetical protein
MRCLDLKVCISRVAQPVHVRVSVILTSAHAVYMFDSLSPLNPQYTTLLKVLLVPINH